jgi:hypothetical protein
MKLKNEQPLNLTQTGLTMTLENTDQALAKVIDAARELSTKLSPDAYDAASRVAQLTAQTDLRAALIWAIISGLLIAFCILGSMAAGEYGPGIVIGGLSAIVFSIAITSWTSPLNNALAKDPKLALAYMVMRKIDRQSEN